MRTYLENLGEIPKVVRVVALRWCRPEIGEDSVVHAHGGSYDRLREGLAVRRETFQEISEDSAEYEVHAVVLHRRISGVCGEKKRCRRVSVTAKHSLGMVQKCTVNLLGRGAPTFVFLRFLT